MYPLGHIGITLLLSRIVSNRFRISLNMKLIVIASMLPDILDKPLGILGIGGGRFIFHSLAFVVLLYFVRKELYFGSLIHLILDRMWEEPEILLYPLLGFEASEVELYPLDFIQFFLQSKYSQIGECVGLVSLIVYKANWLKSNKHTTQ